MQRLRRATVAELFGIDLRSLALFRIALGLLLLADIGTRLQELRAHYTDAGIWPRALAAQELAARKWYFSMHLLGGSEAFAAALFALAAIVAIALVLGFQTRAATVISWALLISLHTRNIAVLNSGDILLGLFLFWGMMLPLGARWSLDSRRRGAAGGSVLSAASAALLGQIALVYLFAAAYKWESIWLVRGDAVRYALNLETIARPLGSWLLQFPGTLRALTFGTLWLEALGPLVAFVPVANGFFRLLTALAFLGFHLIGLELTMNLGLFPFISAAGWLVFLPAWFWEKILRRENAAALPPLRAHWALNATAGAFFLFILLWNLRGFAPQRFGALLPHAMDPLAKLLRLDQRWNMFISRALGSEGWQVAVARLRDGSTVEILTGSDYGEAEVERPRRLSDPFPDYRWGKYPLRSSAKARPARLQAYADYLKREWDRSHPPERAVAALQIYFMREINQIPRQPAEPELIYSDGNAKPAQSAEPPREEPAY